MASLSGNTSKWAIAFAISDNYAFALANVLLGLRTYSPSIAVNADILCYQEGLSNEHKEILLKINQNIIFKDISEVDKLPPEILRDRLVTKTRWGKFVLIKLLGFELLKQYAKVLFLDVDMLIKSDLSSLFDYEGLSWKQVGGWSAKENFKKVFPDNVLNNIVGCSGGCVLFSEEIKNYCSISNEDIRSAYYEVTKNVPQGGIEEKILTYLAYAKRIPVNNLPQKYNCSLMSKKIDEAAIVHFIDEVRDHKPWQNPLIASIFPDWLENYKVWLDLGGEDSRVKLPTQESYVFIRNAPRLLAIQSFLIEQSVDIYDFSYKWDLCRVSFKVRGIPTCHSIMVKMYARRYVIEMVIRNRKNIAIFIEKIKQAFSDSLYEVKITESKLTISSIVGADEYEEELRKFLEILKGTTSKHWMIKNFISDLFTLIGYGR